MFVLSGYNITAVGFWNGDGQADTLFASAYDANGVHLGDILVPAGFISDVAISRVVFDGNTGDGWNHLDGLQTNATVPIPGAVWLLSSGIASIVGIRLRRKKK